MRGAQSGLASCRRAMSTLVFLGLGGYVLNKQTMPGWWVWTVWVSPQSVPTLHHNPHPVSPLMSRIDQIKFPS